MTEELVIMRDRQAVTTSLQVAQNFGKEHKHVLESIKNLAAENSATKNMFVVGTYMNRGKEYPMFYMNRDGFSLLAMGFTGKKALQFKLKYIDAFNQMEKQLQQQKPLSLPEQISLIAKGYENLQQTWKTLRIEWACLVTWLLHSLRSVTQRLSMFLEARNPTHTVTRISELRPIEHCSARIVRRSIKTDTATCR